MMNLKPIQKQKVLDTPNMKPGLLKKKPFAKTSSAPAPVPGGLLKRLTGK